jgi:hypothetical protein
MQQKGQKRYPRQVIVTTSYDDDDKEVNGSDEECMVAAESDIKQCQTWQPNEHFEKLLEAACPNHAYPVEYMLKESTMMKNFMTSGAQTRSIWRPPR